MLVALLVVLGVLVGLGFMAQPNDLSCAAGIFYIFVVIVLATVIAVGAPH